MNLYQVVVGVVVLMVVAVVALNGVMVIDMLYYCYLHSNFQIILHHCMFPLTPIFNKPNLIVLKNGSYHAMSYTTINDCFGYRKTQQPEQLKVIEPPVSLGLFFCSNFQALFYPILKIFLKFIQQGKCIDYYSKFVDGGPIFGFGYNLVNSQDGCHILADCQWEYWCLVVFGCSGDVDFGTDFDNDFNIGFDSWVDSGKKELDFGCNFWGIGLLREYCIELGS